MTLDHNGYSSSIMQDDTSFCYAYGSGPAGAVTLDAKPAGGARA